MKRTITILALLLISATADAAAPSVLPEGDAALRYFFSTISEGGNLGFEGSPMAGWMGTFNAIMMIIGGMLAAYTLIAGTINTANDGEFLGRKWSGAWLPIRTALGASMLLPAFNGFCFAQVIVLWMAQQGSSYANQVWDTFAGDLASMSQIKTVERRDDGYEFARDLMKANICHAALEKSLQQVSEAVDATAININPISNGKTFGYQFGVDDTGVGPFTYRSVTCGEFLYTYQNLGDEAETQLQSTAGNQAQLNQFIVTSQQAQATQFGAMEARFLQTARAFVDDPTTDTISVIKEEVDAYNAMQNSLAHGFIRNLPRQGDSSKLEFLAA